MSERNLTKPEMERIFNDGARNSFPSAVSQYPSDWHYPIIDMGWRRVSARCAARLTACFYLQPALPSRKRSAGNLTVRRNPMNASLRPVRLVILHGDCTHSIQRLRYHGPLQTHAVRRLLTRLRHSCQWAYLTIGGRRVDDDLIPLALKAVR
ncbi:MAG: hypothetical protein KGL39_27430 [Patescibacteria group bacterium]|nr:hypothetical protein [Patescibacteria group bacterium]